MKKIPGEFVLVEPHPDGDHVNRCVCFGDGDFDAEFVLQVTELPAGTILLVDVLTGHGIVTAFKPTTSPGYQTVRVQNAGGGALARCQLLPGTGNLPRFSNTIFRTYRDEGSPLFAFTVTARPPKGL
ncbi:MAG TPA: hypothetical protein VK550_09240 [Polyangiaceae bacterium]|nr:hypothetical protein [Polyangiaceae bacterium]